MFKLVENTFRAVNVALMNRFLVMCDKLGLDTWSVLGSRTARHKSAVELWREPVCTKQRARGLRLEKWMSERR
jgi:UDP-N-acetyl-D-mannosaminuronate dehydrogenase